MEYLMAHQIISSKYGSRKQRFKDVLIKAQKLGYADLIHLLI